MCSQVSQGKLWRRYVAKLLIFAATVALSGDGYEASFAAPLLNAGGLNLSDDSTGVGPTGRSVDDGWPDLSAFMDKPYGFLPVVSPITEPAIGYGVWGGPTFISEPTGRTEAGFGRPNITFAGGAWTENDTWAVMAEDDRNWLNERLQTVAAAVYASINLEFHGVGDDAFLKDHPIDYNLTPVGGLVRAKYRLGRSCFWAGLGYQWFKTEAEMDIPDEISDRENIRRDSHVGGLLPLLNYDSRDNIFTPTHGTNIEVSGGLFSKALGGDASFQTGTVTVIQYVALHSRLTLGMRGDANLSFGDVPFYLYPSVSLRGAPAMRYQGETVAQGELEVRWQFWKRISLIGLGGYGVAWNDLEHFDNSVDVVTVGGGLRYELARKYGVHAGVDVVWAPDGIAIYVQFGNAWMWK